MPSRLPPIGFWSYARQDEEAARGKLSSLRARLQGELQQQYGRNQIRIFQDVAAIAPGDSWNRELHDAIQNSTFLVPIITPAFLESEWCCQEVRLFRQREADLNAAHPELEGRSRIFPIHYLDIKSAQPFDDEVLPFLQTRQWLDFRALRFSPEDDPKLQMALAQLAGGMNELLQIRVDLPEPAAAPPPPSPPPTTRARSAEPSPLDDMPAPPLTATPWFRRPAILAGGGIGAALLVAVLALGTDEPDPGPAPAPAMAASDVTPAPVAPGTAPAADAAEPADPATIRNGYRITGAKLLFPRTANTRSGPSGGASIPLTVDNQTDDAFSILWIDTESRPQPYGEIEAHSTFEVQTYPAHLWQLRRRQDGKPITSFQPEAEGGTVVIANAVAAPELAETQALPPGNYAATCTDIRIVGTALNAICADVEQNMVATTLPAYAECQGRIENVNGVLRCR